MYIYVHQNVYPYIYIYIYIYIYMSLSLSLSMCVSYIKASQWWVPWGAQLADTGWLLARIFMFSQCCSGWMFRCPSPLPTHLMDHPWVRKLTWRYKPSIDVSIFLEIRVFCVANVIPKQSRSCVRTAAAWQRQCLFTVRTKVWNKLVVEHKSRDLTDFNPWRIGIYFTWFNHQNGNLDEQK